MKVYFFVHLTGADTGISGIPRVVKNLGRELALTPGVQLIPVSWSKDREAIVHTEQKLLDNLARHGGPEFTASIEARNPIQSAAGDWLLVPEAPHLGSQDVDYPSLLIDRLIGSARHAGLRVAAVCHDILPLTHQFGRERRGAFADMVSDADRGDEGERQRLRFAVYAHALALVDLVLPVSRTSGTLLADWLIRHGHQAGRLPPIEPILLPEEVRATPRVIPNRTSAASAHGPIEFLTVGTICTHKNQLAVMTAFQRLIDRRPDLDIRLNVVGAVAPDVAFSASQLARRSGGRIVLHGRLSDARLEAMRAASRANVFVSLAEGYGLPVAESLWGGKPCLCSNEGSVAEIAAGGGCLPVDPLDLDDIEAGFETLATNAARYDELLQEIAARAMRNWRDYASEIAGRLVDCMEGRLPRRIPSILGEAAPDAATPDGSPRALLTLAAADLRAPDAYVSGRNRPIRRNGAIRFDRESDGGVNESLLFFGPYARLAAGLYEFAFDGELSGELDLAFTADEGASIFARVTVSSFAEPIVVDLPRSVEQFEIVGSRTPTLERLILRGAVVELQAHGGGPRAPNLASVPPATGVNPEKTAAIVRAARGEPAAEEPVYGRDDNGRPMRFPCTIPADGMRVPDAYGVGARSLLRTDSTIAFRLRDHGRVREKNLFFGPYFRLEPGDYTIRIDGDLQGRLQLRVTRKFASETLLDTIVKSFADPIRLTLTGPAEKVEVIGDRLTDTRAMTLRAIEIFRATAPKEEPAMLHAPDSSKLGGVVSWGRTLAGVVRRGPSSDV
jgi:glycosyltransferase involved in cell wall biosynthesis